MDGRKYNLTCVLTYSIDDKHPFYKSVKDKHVRAILKYGGYVICQELNEENENKNNGNDENMNPVRAIYLNYLDPCGWIPQWVVNLVAPEQGMVVKQFAKNWHKVEQIMQLRMVNNYEKNYEAMFDVANENKESNCEVIQNNNNINVEEVEETLLK